MTSSSLGWWISDIKPAIDHRLRLCDKYREETHNTFPSLDLVGQLKRLRSVHKTISDQPNVGKVYINLEEIVRELGECQLFLDRHRATRRTVSTDPELLRRLESHTQRLDVYLVLLQK